MCICKFFIGLFFSFYIILFSCLQLMCFFPHVLLDGGCSPSSAIVTGSVALKSQQSNVHSFVLGGDIVPRPRPYWNDYLPSPNHWYPLVDVVFALSKTQKQCFASRPVHPERVAVSQKRFPAQHPRPEFLSKAQRGSPCLSPGPITHRPLDLDF